MGHHHRRGGVAQQPPRLCDLGEAFQQVVRDRLGLDVYLPARGARPCTSEESRADATLHRGEALGGFRDAAGRDNAPLRRAREICQVAQAHLRRGARQAAPARTARRARAEETEALAASRRKIAVRDRARAPQAGSGKVARASHRVLDARRARVPVGALKRVARPARASTAGLVPPRPTERPPPARGILAPAALLRVEGFAARGSGKPKKPASGGYFYGFQPIGFSG